MLVSNKLLGVLILAIAFFDTAFFDTSEHRDPFFCYQFIDVDVLTNNRYTVNDDVLELMDGNEKEKYLTECPDEKDVIGHNYRNHHLYSACYMITYNDNAEDGKLKAMAGCLRDHEWLKHDKADKNSDTLNTDRFDDPECSLRGNLKQTDRYYFVDKFVETKRLELCNQKLNLTFEQVKECQAQKINFDIEKVCYSSNYTHLPLKNASEKFQHMCKKYRVDNIDFKEVQLDASIIALDLATSTCITNELENPYKDTTPHCYYMASATGNGSSLSFSGGCVSKENLCHSIGLFHKGCTDDPEIIKTFFHKWSASEIPAKFCCCKGEMCNEGLVAQVSLPHISCHEYPLINIDIPEEVEVANKRSKCIGEYCMRISMKDDQGHHYAMASCLTKNDYLVIKKDMLDLKTKEEDPHTKCAKNEKGGKNAQIISDLFKALNTETHLEFKEACFSTTQNSNSAPAKKEKHRACYKYDNLANNEDNIKKSATCLSDSKDKEDSCFFAYYENTNTNKSSVSGGCVMDKKVCDWNRQEHKRGGEAENPTIIDNCITSNMTKIKEIYKEMGYEDLRENRLPVMFCCCSGSFCNDKPASSTTTTAEPITTGAATSTVSLALLAVVTLLAGLPVYRLATDI